MENEWRRWESSKSDYLKAVERELARTDHPRKDEVLADVRNHLEESSMKMLCTADMVLPVHETVRK